MIQEFQNRKKYIQITSKFHKKRKLVGLIQPTRILFHKLINNMISLFSRCHVPRVLGGQQRVRRPRPVQEEQPLCLEEGADL